ncbi:MAG: hypothetical protein ACRD2J_10635 [Thermoanaerobaculia bacterium]
MAKDRDDLDAEINALFRLDLAEFTAARNTLAARLKKEGRAIDAERVKSLPKPPAPAWAVNQLYWRNPQAMDRLLAAAERIRKAQTGRVKNADLRALFAEKKKMTAELTNEAAAILRTARHGASPEAMRRVSATLESLAVWGETDGAPKAGRLSADLDPPGFDALAAVAGGTKTESGKVLSFRAPKPAEDPVAVRARAREAAEKALREARREAAAAEAAQEKAIGRIVALEKQKQEIESRYAEAKEEARNAAKKAKAAAQAVADAERSLARMKTALE